MSSGATRFGDAGTSPSPVTGRLSRRDPTLRLAAVAAAIGVFLLDLDLEAAGLPGGLPLASLSWVLMAGAWLLPAALIVTRPGGVTGTTSGTTVWFVALFAVALGSTIWSVHPARTAIVAALSAMAFLGGTALTRHLGWHWMVRLLSIALLAFLGLGLVRDAALGPLLTALPDVLSGQRRMSGLTFSPTDLGRIAGFGLVLAVIAAHATAGFERLVHVVSALVALAAEVSSGTRLIALALVALGALALVRRRSASAVAVLALVALGVLAATTNPEGVVAAVGRPEEAESHVLEVAGRRPVWEAAVQQWGERPLLGYGWGSNETVFREALVRDEISFEAFTAHNLLVGVLVDTGIVGATLLVGGIVALWWSVRRLPSAFFVLLLLLLTGTTEATFTRPSLVFAVLGALVAATSTAADQRSVLRV